MIRRLLHKFQKERDLTTGSISKNIWILAIPMIISNMLQAGLNLVDMFWVGRLGAAAIAAVAMSGSLLMIVMFIMIGVGIGTTAMVARAIGENDQAKADNAAMQSLILGFFSSIILALIGYFSAPFLLKLLGADAEVLTLGLGYMRILFVGVNVIFYIFFITAILNGAGDAATPMIIAIIMTVANIILDPLLIFGIGPFPRLGVDGAALASVLAEGIGSIIALEVLLRGRSRVHVRLQYLRVNFLIIFQILRIGVPASAQMILRGFLNLALIVVVAGFGTQAVAAFGVCIRFNMLALMPGFALGMAAATLVGQNLGAKKPERAMASAWLATGYYAVFMGAMTVLFLIFAPSVIAFFNNDAQVVEIGTNYLRISAWGYVFVALGIVLSRSLSGAGDTIVPLIITFVALWLVQIPLAFYLSRFTSLNLDGVWVAILVAYLLQGTMTAIWFQMGKWKAKKV
ncbi:hypothetical protein A2291_04030 [candidate division WOR-1 bacterium RIFOXYB2_FULL_42_35]|uniref:Probable multidrug resistance protein NorM n=1 Tax=candidate division WOR-1 bacterium RIFOXYC2_FULL_41_25 TaxID=1802586 RepID=A0A1F4TMU7_UNCSA|nr:MAG: hypothetical protein A2247_00870 [candidate division WOR-1 bacterium RIFOXYA2_FULL_41_14]OGC24350.1 MAG: hypothetical protein A2291_04030 [candidate division WOR-1 bacterium RIFOXYB2_FULL_42_35]OGC34052.1 MAG: hypothetical protein A2462_01435 [candidate division WOR-1 bacterium RIFOXYC2_FULL_41_25]